MTGRPQKNAAAARLAKTEPAATKWLPVLEQELKRRVGWTNEAISPFRRVNRARKSEAKILRAA